MQALLLLSQGRSSRMGQDKASLRVQGQPLIDWQINRFETAGFRVVAKLKDARSGFLGPLAGIEAACLAHPEVTGWWVLPVDMPRVAVDTLLALQSADISRYYADYPMPCYLADAKATLNWAQRQLDDPAGQRSIKALLTHLQAEPLSTTGLGQQLINLNTPQQWRDCYGDFAYEPRGQAI